MAMGSLFWQAVWGGECGAVPSLSATGSTGERCVQLDLFSTAHRTLHGSCKLCLSYRRPPTSMLSKLSRWAANAAAALGHKEGLRGPAYGQGRCAHHSVPCCSHSGRRGSRMPLAASAFSTADPHVNVQLVTAPHPLQQPDACLVPSAFSSPNRTSTTFSSPSTVVHKGVLAQQG